MKKELVKIYIPGSKTISLIFETQTLRNNDIEIFQLGKSKRVKGFRKGNPQVCVRLYGLYNAN